MNVLKLTAKLFWLTVILLLNLSHTARAESTFQEIIASPALLQKVQQGGYVIYMRHGNTDNSTIDDPNDFDLTECDTQRLLSDLGQQVTQKVGQYVQQAKIPVGEVFASPLCRTQESALNVFGRFTPEPALMYPGGISAAQKIIAIDKTRALVSMPVAANTNRVLVAHAPNMMDLMNYTPKEATLVIFKPQGNNQFEYQGSIRPQDWPTLLKSN